MADNIVDVTMIGAGPAGLFGCFWAGQRKMSARIIESLPEVGGQLTTLYPEKFIYDVGAIPKMLAKDMVKACAEQGLQFGAEVCLEEEARELIKVDDKVWNLKTTKGDRLTRTVVITAGVGAMAPRKLGDPEVERFEGKGLYYFAKNFEVFRGKNLLIVGGGDSAVDWANSLSGIAKTVTLAHRRDQFRAQPGSVEEMDKHGVRILLFHELRTVRGGEFPEEAVVFQNKTNEETTLPCEAVILALGFKSDLGAIKEWGIALEGNRKILVNTQMQTNLPGIYAAGDVSTFPGKIDLIATGFGEVAVAVNDAKVYVDPTSRAFPGHSSEMAPPPGLQEKAKVAA